jgi:hypothetical protein
MDTQSRKSAHRSRPEELVSVGFWRLARHTDGLQEQSVEYIGGLIVSLSDSPEVIEA